MPTATIEARIAALSAVDEGASEAPADTPADATETPAATPLAEAGAAPAANPATPPDPEAEIREQRRALLNEKLERQREARAAARLEEQARADRAAAEADRKAAASEKERWDAARKDYKKAFEAMGLSAREVYEEMTRQAIEADTPEAKLKSMQEAWKAELEQHVAPLKSEVERLRARDAEVARREAELAQREYDASMAKSFQAAVQDPAYVELRTEYDDAELFEYIRGFDRNPVAFYNAASKYNVPVSSPDGFSIPEALSVLKAAQDEHNRGREQRRARLAPPAQSPAAQAAQPPVTVNGTAARRDAETISNDLASSSASEGRRVLSRDEKIEREIARLERR